MGDPQSLIQFYTTAFYVCLIVAALALALGILMFIRFDIPTIFAIRTGRAKKAAVRKFRETVETGETPTPQLIAEAPAAAAQDPPGGETVPLKAGLAAAPAGFRFTMTEDTVVTHTEEVI